MIATDTIFDIVKFAKNSYGKYCQRIMTAHQKYQMKQS